MNWSTLYPEKPEEAKVEFADVGCGYGGLLGIIIEKSYVISYSLNSLHYLIVALANLFPEKYMLGMEIRTSLVTPC